MNKNILKWNSSLLPVPHSRTLELPALDTRKFCSLRFNKQVSSALYKTNLTLERSTYVFEMLPEEKASVSIKHNEAYLVKSGEDEFTPFISDSVYDLDSFEIRGIDIPAGSYRIESISVRSKFLFNLYDDMSNLVLVGEGNDTIELEHSGNWLAFENLEKFLIQIKVTAL